MPDSKLKSDVSYLLGWFCCVFPLFGLLAAAEYYVRGSGRMGLQVLVSSWLPWICFIIVVTLFPRADGALVLVLVLPVITLYFLRRLEWPAPTPIKADLKVSVIISFVIFGILMAIAIPAYQIRAIRDKVWVASDEAKQRVERYVRGSQKLPETDADIGIPFGVGNKYLESLNVGANGEITVHLSKSVETGGMLFNESAAGETVILTPHLSAGALTWSCDGGTLPDKYRSRECRHGDVR
jgi:type IV pilus assembly protein PilA